MFTGLIEEVGAIQRVAPGAQAAKLYIAARTVLAGTRIGDSIAVNGACLTVVELGSGFFAAEAMAETLRATTLGNLKTGDLVNLERALRLGDRLGGHLVSGHVDGVGVIKAVEQEGPAIAITIAAPPELARYLARKGSVAVDGVSLTIIDVAGGSFRVGIIPHTQQETSIRQKKPGAAVNLEVDLLARYLERLLNPPAPEEAGQGLSLDFLAKHGFS